MVSDKNIIEGCIIGQREAYSNLFNKYSPIMLVICMRYSKNKAEAEDIMQEGFIKVFKNIKSFRHEGSFEGWIKRIMINTAINHHQKNLKHYYHDNIDNYQESINTDNEVDVAPDLPVPKEQIMNMIQNLPEGYKFVFNMYVFEGYSHKEIAKELNITVSTSKSQLFKARNFLRKQLEPFINKKMQQV